MSTDDYQCIERAIHFLHANHRAQPSLAEVAAHVRLSDYHFQRLFRCWAGVSPKRFLQYLTAEEAKHRLRDAASVLDVADGARPMRSFSRNSIATTSTTRSARRLPCSCP